MPRPRTDSINWRFVFGFWLLLTAALMVRPIALGGVLPLLGDDDMRMVSIQQWLAGGGFQDSVIWRDNQPFGASLHWSRLIDAPLAGLILLFQPIFGNWAESLAMLIWPVPLLLALLALSVVMVRQLRIEGDILPALALPVLSLVLLAEFVPGRIDHHNVQIVLTVGMAVATMAARTDARLGWVTGLLAATSLAIGMETLPFVVLTIVLHALFWAMEPERQRAMVQRFAVALALFTLVHFFVATPPTHYLTVACDVVSLPYVAASGLAAAALLLATRLGGRLTSAPQRLVLVGALGATAGLVVLLIFPQCRGGPYAQVDSELLARLFPAIDEAMPVWSRLAIDPDYAIAAVLVPLVALVITAVKVVRSEADTRINWLVLLAFLAGSFAIALLQIRGAKLVTPFTVPAGMLVINAARARYLGTLSKKHAALLVGAWLLFAPVGQQTLLNLLARGIATVMMRDIVNDAVLEMEARADCFQGGNYAALAALPRGNVIAPIRIGPHILRLTPHSIVSAGFHRNTQGTLDNLWFFNGSEAGARRLVAERDLDYLVFCMGYPEIPTVETEPSSFLSLEEQGRRWDWLRPISAPDAPIQIFAIDRSTSAPDGAPPPEAPAGAPAG